MNLLPDIKKILYCTRIGPNSAYIYRHAMALAEKFDAAITVLHVMETLTPDQEARINGYIGPDSIHDVVEHEEKDALVRIKQQGTVIIFDAKHKVGVDGQTGFQINFLVKVFQNKLPHPQRIKLSGSSK